MQTTIRNHRFALTVDTLGAQPVSLKNADGAQLLWTGDPAYWAGQAPVLFPMVGALRNGRATLGDKTLEMGQHGFARRREFTLTGQTDASLSYTLTADDATRAMYPFDFALTVTYTLTEEGYVTRFTVKNEDKAPMPFAIGGHPGFNVPVGEDAAFEDYTIVFEQEEDQVCPAIVVGQGLIDPANSTFTLRGREIPLRHELFYKDALVFEGLNSHKAAVLNKATGHGVEMDFTGFPMFGIWSAANDGPYVCLEPWTGCATRTDEGDDFAAKHGMKTLAPGETFEIGFTVRFF